MKILIIEDDSGLNRGISFALGQEGYETISAQTLQEGESLFEKEKPDAVILDLNLPDGDGVVFCKKIRQLSGTESETAIVMLTVQFLPLPQKISHARGQSRKAQRQADSKYPDHRLCRHCFSSHR